MALNCVSTGEVLCLKRLLNHTAADDCKLILYTNNATISDATVVGDLTEVTGIDGYAAKTLTGSSWTVATVNNVSTASYAAQTFTVSEAVSCYGYALLNNAKSALIIAEAFPSVYTLPSGGGSITITPTITCD